MLDVLLALGFLALPLAAWWWSRSATFVAAALVLGFGIAGNLVQTTVAWGAAWNVRTLQLLSLAVMVLVLVGGHYVRSRTVSEPLGRQLMAVGVPVAVLGLFLVAMRLLAPEDPGALTGFGYLMNHPMGEDNAKFLNLAAQLADGRTIAFNGYAAGPLLLVMSVVAAFISVLSMILLGGVNQVAVVLNTVIGTQHLFMILVPFAFAPFADRLRTRPSTKGMPQIPVPAIWLGAGVLFLGNAVLTEYGHVSLQFVLIILVLWAVSFVARSPWQVRLVLTIAIATSASVWLPLNVLGIVLLLAVIVWMLLGRRWWGLSVAVLALAVSWDALISSILFLLGIDVGESEPGVATEAASEGPGSATSLVSQSLELFQIPGGTEKATAVLAVLAGAVVVAAVLAMRRLVNENQLWSAFAPFVIFFVYVLFITVGDSIASGAAPNYGTVKVTFALAMMVLAAYVPVALTSVDANAAGMTPVRWLVGIAVVMLLMMDTLLPRALDAISPIRWGGINASAPIFWAAAEVKPTGSQDLSTLPVACVVAPPVSAQPSALPWGQEAYSCTRLLVGMNGLEGQTGFMVQWLGTEWSQQRSIWDETYTRIEGSVADFAGRPVIMMGKNAELVGITTFGDLLRQNLPS